MNNIALTPEELKAIGVRNEFISKWGADTISTFEKSIAVCRPSDLLCITTLSVCSTYSNAIAALLQNGLRMPTKALLRVLFEVMPRPYGASHHERWTNLNQAWKRESQDGPR